MKFASLASSVFALAALAALPSLASAQSSYYMGVPSFGYSGPTAQLVVNIQPAQGIVPATTGQVTITAAGASFSNVMSSTGTLTYATNFNDTKVINFIPGNYNVTLAPVNGYSYTYSSGCSGAVPYSGGTPVTCTVTVSNYAANAGTLTVYTNVSSAFQNGSYYGTGSYAPSNFTISVSGNTPSPSSFQGSTSGTLVTLGAGAYSVQPAQLGGWNVTQSGNCSGSIQPGQALTCTVMYSSNTGSWNNVPCGYFSGYGYGNCYNYTYTPAYPNYYNPLPSLSCTPSYQSASVGQTVTFTAQGGLGTYSWSLAGQNYPNSGSTFSPSMQSSGLQTVTVSSGGTTATCSVNVSGSLYTAPTYFNVSVPPVTTAFTAPTAYATQGYVVKGAYAAPALPNTGFNPQGGVEAVFGILSVLIAAVFAYPYVRKTFAAVLN